MGVFWNMVRCPCPIPILDTIGYDVELALTSPKSFRANLTSAGFDLTDISDVSKDAKMKGFVTLLMWCHRIHRSHDGVQIRHIVATMDLIV
ncbi:hypothetical protein L195_g005236, partial [Trifolium pratense]